MIDATHSVQKTKFKEDIDDNNDSLVLPWIMGMIFKHLTVRLRSLRVSPSSGPVFEPVRTHFRCWILDYGS